MRTKYVKIGVVTSLLLSFSVQAFCQTTDDNHEHFAIKANDASELFNKGSHLLIGDGVAQDYNQAFNTFIEGANLGSASCIHQIANMYFNGLGCTQSYSEALKYYLQGKDANYMPSAYMSAICYRNGYGVERDIKLANSILKSLADKNFEPAINELKHDLPEAMSFPDRNDERIKCESVITNHPVAGKDLTGYYSGDIVIYDNSNKVAINVVPVTVFISQEENGVYGSIYMDDEDFSFEAMENDGKLHFENSSLSMKSRYGKSINYNLSLASVGADEETLCANVATTLEGFNEPGHPMYLSVKKIETANVSEISQKESNIKCRKISDSQYAISYNIPSGVNDYSLVIANASGETIKQVNGQDATPGDKETIISIKPNDNIIIVNINYKDSSNNAKFQL